MQGAPSLFICGCGCEIHYAVVGIQVFFLHHLVEIILKESSNGSTRRVLHATALLVRVGRNLDYVSHVNSCSKTDIVVHLKPCKLPHTTYSAHFQVNSYNLTFSHFGLTSSSQDLERCLLHLFTLPTIALHVENVCMIQAIQRQIN